MITSVTTRYTKDKMEKTPSEVEDQNTKMQNKNAALGSDNVEEGQNMVNSRRTDGLFQLLKELKNFTVIVNQNTNQGYPFT